MKYIQCVYVFADTAFKSIHIFILFKTFCEMHINVLGSINARTDFKTLSTVEALKYPRCKM